MDNVVGRNDQLCLVDALKKLEQGDDFSEDSDNIDPRNEQANILAKQYE